MPPSFRDRMARSLPAAMVTYATAAPRTAPWGLEVQSVQWRVSATGARCQPAWLTSATQTPALTEQTVHHKSQDYRRYLLRLVANAQGLLNINTLVGQTIPKAQSSSPKSWPDISFEGAPPQNVPD